MSCIYFLVYFFQFTSGHWIKETKVPGGDKLLSLSHSFNELLRLIAVGLSQLTRVIQTGLEVEDLFSFFLSKSFLHGYQS